jgi:hypothetical protein
MIKLLAMAGIAALVTACAAPAPRADLDPMHSGKGSTLMGASNAALLGFHGPLDRRLVGATDGPN